MFVQNRKVDYLRTDTTMHELNLQTLTYVLPADTKRRNTRNVYRLPYFLNVTDSAKIFFLTRKIYSKVQNHCQSYKKYIVLIYASFMITTK